MHRYLALREPDNNGFRFMLEHGSEDRRSHYSHNEKYPNGGFTGERCPIHEDGPFKGRPVFFRLDDHEDRLERTIEAVEWLTIPASREERIKARMELVARNYGDSYLSVMFGSIGDVGVYPPSSIGYVLINSRDMHPFRTPYLPKRIVEQGMTVRITEPDIHRGPFSRFSAAKLGRNYLFSNINKHRAKQAGVDDGIMLDEHGNLSELSVSNLIVYLDNCLVTPWAQSSPLNGIAKQTVLTIAEETLGIMSSEERLGVPHLKRARAIITTGTAIGPIQVIRVIDSEGQLIWEQNEDFAKQQLVGLSEFYWNVLFGRVQGYHPDWFTPVPEDLLAQFAMTRASSEHPAVRPPEIPVRGH